MTGMDHFAIEDSKFRDSFQFLLETSENLDKVDFLDSGYFVDVEDYPMKPTRGSPRGVGSSRKGKRKADEGSDDAGEEDVEEDERGDLPTLELFRHAQGSSHELEGQELVSKAETVDANALIEREPSKKKSRLEDLSAPSLLTREIEDNKDFMDMFMKKMLSNVMKTVFREFQAAKMSSSQLTASSLSPSSSRQPDVEVLQHESPITSRMQEEVHEAQIPAESQGVEEVPMLDSVPTDEDVAILSTQEGDAHESLPGASP